jgi:hypothetical protein
MLESINALLRNLQNYGARNINGPNLTHQYTKDNLVMHEYKRSPYKRGRR